jgi:hypothetical protein
MKSDRTVDHICIPFISIIVTFEYAVVLVTFESAVKMVSSRCFCKGESDPAALLWPAAV